MKKKRKQPKLTVEQAALVADMISTILTGALVRAAMRERKEAKK